MNPVKKLLDWLLPPTPNYYYRLSKEAEVEKVTETVQLAPAASEAPQVVDWA